MVPQVLLLVPPCACLSCVHHVSPVPQVGGLYILAVPWFYSTIYLARGRMDTRVAQVALLLIFLLIFLLLLFLLFLLILLLLLFFLFLLFLPSMWRMDSRRPQNELYKAHPKKL